MKVYVAGPMTGIEGWNYPAFHDAAARLRAAGHEVVNPAELGEKYGAPEEISEDPEKMADLIIEETDALETCEAIYLLRGWNRSRGTLRELRIAFSHGLEILVDDGEGV